MVHLVSRDRAFPYLDYAAEIDESVVARYRI